MAIGGPGGRHHHRCRHHRGLVNGHCPSSGTYPISCSWWDTYRCTKHYTRWASIMGHWWSSGLARPNASWSYLQRVPPASSSRLTTRSSRPEHPTLPPPSFMVHQPITSPLRILDPNGSSCATYALTSSWPPNVSWHSGNPSSMYRLYHTLIKSWHTIMCSPSLWNSFDLHAKAVHTMCFQVLWNSWFMPRNACVAFVQTNDMQRSAGFVVLHSWRRWS